MQPTHDDHYISSGLECPYCRYDLTSLTSRRCPECGKEFLIVRPEDVRFKPSRFEQSSMICPSCSFPNRGVMPKSCRQCGRVFSWHERIFGVSGSLLHNICPDCRRANRFLARQCRHCQRKLSLWESIGGSH